MAAPSPALLWTKSPILGSVIGAPPALQDAALTWAGGDASVPELDEGEFMPASQLLTTFESKQFGVVVCAPTLGDQCTSAQLEQVRDIILSQCTRQKPMEISLGVLKTSMFPQITQGNHEDGEKKTFLLAFLGTELRLRQERTTLERALQPVPGLGERQPCFDLSLFGAEVHLAAYFRRAIKRWHA